MRNERKTTGLAEGIRQIIVRRKERMAKKLFTSESVTEGHPDKAVSYTHLDVYKRQTLKRGKTPQSLAEALTVWNKFSNQEKSLVADSVIEKITIFKDKAELSWRY